MPPDPRVVVPHHLTIVTERLHDARASDEIGRRALEEARQSLLAARLYVGAGQLLQADQEAASVDDLLAAAAAGPQPPPAPASPDRSRGPAETLSDVDVLVSALTSTSGVRVHTLIKFARDVASQARRETALAIGDASELAMRAQSIARAAAHVAIAADPNLRDVLPPPPPPHPARR